MPKPLPENCHFYIERKLRASEYQMPGLEAATDHYAIGYSVSGDRIFITPTTTYTLYSGEVGTIPPFLYHKNGPASDAPYDRFLIKFTLEFVKPFTDRFGEQALEQIYRYPSHRFLEATQKKIFHLFDNMLSVYQCNSLYSEFRLQCMLMELLMTVLEESLPQRNEAYHPTSLTPPIIDALYYIENHYSENISLDIVADIAGFSSGHFSRVFQSQLGKSYSEYVVAVRLKHVKELLLTTNKSITEIALDTGYSHASNLTEQFKKKIGMTPLSYRKGNKLM